MFHFYKSSSISERHGEALRVDAILFQHIIEVGVRRRQAQAYFNDMLKKNGVYAQRFATPFAEEG